MKGSTHSVSEKLAYAQRKVEMRELVRKHCTGYNESVIPDIVSLESHLVAESINMH